MEVVSPRGLGWQAALFLLLQLEQKEVIGRQSQDRSLYENTQCELKQILCVTNLRQLLYQCESIQCSVLFNFNFISNSIIISLPSSQLNYQTVDVQSTIKNVCTVFLYLFAWAACHAQQKVKLVHGWRQRKKKLHLHLDLFI